MTAMEPGLLLQQVAACQELIRLFSAELDRRVAFQQGAPYLAVTWWDTDGSDRQEAYTLAQRSAAEYTYARLVGFGFPVSMSHVTLIKSNEKEA